MKKNYLVWVAGLVLGGVGNVSAADYNNIVCHSASGFQQLYQSPNITFDSGVNEGCNPSAECATGGLQRVVATIPEPGVAGYSGFFDKYIEVSQKSVSKPTLETTVSRMTGAACVSSTYYGEYQVDCSQSTACVAVSVGYVECTKIAYDPLTGAKSITCPSGKVIQP